MNNVPQSQDLNLFTKLILGLVVIRHTFAIFQNIGGFCLYSAYGESAPFVWGMITSILMIVCITLTFRMSKVGVYGFFALQILNMIVSIALNNTDTSSAFAAIFYSIVFTLLLQLRCNGRSGWQTIFDDKSIRHQKKANKSTETNPSLSLLFNRHPFRMSKRSLRIILSVIIFIFVIVIGGFVCNAYIDSQTPEAEMAKADIAFKQGKIADAIDLYTQLAGKGYIPAKTKLGILYLENDSVPLDTIKAKSFLEDVAPLDTIALNYVMHMYRGYLYKNHDYENRDKAEYFANLAIRQGHCVGFANLVLGIFKIWSDKDYSLGFYYCKQAADLKEPIANRILAQIFINGWGCEVDYKKALFHLHKELEIGEDARSYYFLGCMYKYGDGVEQNIGKGLDFFKKAAALGSEEAKEELGEWDMNRSTGIYTLEL